MFDFFWVPLFSALVCVLAVLLLRPLAFRGGLLDRPGGRKQHSGNVPLIGGIAVTIAVGVSALIFLYSKGYYVSLLAGLIVLALGGMIDDLRGIAPVPKLGIQLFAAILMTSWGNVYLHSLGDIFARREIELLNWGIPLTLFAVVSLVNAMNMIDGLDGLAGGMAFMIFGWMAYLAGEVGNLPAQRMCVIFCGGIFGFLLFNMQNPVRGDRRIFLGDAGSMMIGYGIVWFAVELSQKSYNGGASVPPVVMLWIVGFLLIDLLAVVARRVIKGRNPLYADRTHMHHILLRLHVSQEAIVWLILGSNMLLGLIGVIAWKQGASEQSLFLGFLILTAGHLMAMRHAWRFIRIGRRVFGRRR